MFSSNSTKSGGILDHERNLISLADRLKKPNNYYVAKEMQVYEIVSDKSISLISLHKSMSSLESNKCLYRKWTKFSQGTICRATRVAVVDYNDGCDQVDNSYWSFLKNVACCKFNNKKMSDMAIEFKIIESFDELSKLNSTDENGQSSGEKDLNNSSKKIDNKKSYYLPLNESNLNNDIDLIPISNSEKHLSLNNLQTIQNLIKNDMLVDNCLELKLFDDNPFNKANMSNKASKLKNTHFEYSQFGKNNHYVKLNQHLELDKYLSIFELTQFISKARILIGFDLNAQELFFLPIDQLNLNLKSNKNKFIKMNEFQEKNSKLVKNFRLTNLESYQKIARLERENFRCNINKIETFSTLKSKSEAAKQKLPTKQTINNFSDLVNIETDSDYHLSKTNSTNSSSSSSVYNNNIKLNNHNQLSGQKQEKSDKGSIEIINVESLIASNKDNGFLGKSSIFESSEVEIEPKIWNENKLEVFSLNKKNKIFDTNILANNTRQFDYKNEDFDDDYYIIKL